MAWSIVYFIIAIIAAVIGVWNLAQRRFVFLSIACLVWFLIVLFTFIIPVNIMAFELLPGTTVGNLATYIVMPILIVLAFFSRRRAN
jgi:hypothetical protein